MSIPVTRLWHTNEQGKRRLMATIDSGSQFFKFKAPPDLHKIEQREKCAEILKRGWIEQGGMRFGSWEIEHGQSEPKKFSKMTNDILARSRENIGV